MIKVQAKELAMVQPHTVSARERERERDRERERERESPLGERVESILQDTSE